MQPSQGTSPSIGLHDRAPLYASIIDVDREADDVQPMWTSQTGGHEIRRLRPGDAAEWFSAVERSREHLTRWEEWCEAVTSEEQACQVLSHLQELEIGGHFFSFCIMDPCSRQIVGGVSISLVQPEHRCANLGYWMSELQQGKGLCTWAARKVADHAFRALRFNRLEVVVRTDNHASARVAHKLGAQYEGLARSRLCSRDRFFDAHVFSLLPDDTPPTQA